MNKVSKLSRGLANGLLLSLISFTFIQCQSLQPSPPSLPEKVPIIYHPGYNIAFGGLERLHPFDSKKYGRVHKALVENGLSKNQFYTPAPIEREALLRVHSAAYLQSLEDPKTVAQISELSFLKILPASKVRKSLLTPMRLATGGTLLGAELALNHGWAINLSGGYHHAKEESGEGFCALADIPVAAHHLWATQNPELRIMVVDLDAHQGNGISSIFKTDPRVSLYDIYNKDVYPQDQTAESYLDHNHPLPSKTGDTEYLALLKSTLPNAIDQASPDLLIYNAGTDIYEKDPLGGFAITREGILQRDQIVFGLCDERQLPILMVLSGGYTRESADIIADSIKALPQLR